MPRDKDLKARKKGQRPTEEQEGLIVRSAVPPEIVPEVTVSREE